ncbi:MAG: Tim44 domain-containing protein [Alcanivorax sediminis]|uniref:Tim44 domain-containing protein n=1 Tax=Alcanivorax sediminis TaxID=2663008 RepID=UPI003C56FC28
MMTGWNQRGLMLATILWLACEPALAGPGGTIAKAAFETFWGRVALGALTIIFLPLILMVLVREKLAERRTRKDLRFMTERDPRFDWLTIQQRAKDCFHRVHSGWEKEDLTPVSDWMTTWYWQNQQQVFLDKWKREGLVNVCNVKRMGKIRPLLFVHRNLGHEHEGSLLVISMTAHMQDYLAKRVGGQVVEGSKRYKEVETVWSFTMDGGDWKVSDIEEGGVSLAYAKLIGELPPIETTLNSDLSA